MLPRIFEDRKQAGRLLVAPLGELISTADQASTVVLALPRGGVPIGFEIARGLGLKLDVLVVRKIGHPIQPEYGIGAITEEGDYWFDPAAVGIYELTEAEKSVLQETGRREVDDGVRKYRGNRQLSSVENKTIILADDGLATGVTARVAAKYLRARGAKRILLAAPVCSSRTANELRKEIDEVVCAQEPSTFLSVGQFYKNFDQVTDGEVLSLLASPIAKAGGASVNESGKATSSERPNEVAIDVSAQASIKGFFHVPINAKGLVIFAHGSGSGRLSPRNQQVARALNNAGFATLLFDLLTDIEAQNRANVFDIPLLAQRLVIATKWARERVSMPIGYFGASTGAGAALWAAAELKNQISAVVSRGGRPDLAIDRLNVVTAPTLLIVGSLDIPVIALNERALSQLSHGELELVPGASHLFEEAGTLEQVSRHAIRWFERHFAQPRQTEVTVEELINQSAHPLRNRLDVQSIVEKLKTYRIVMLGEASHGTQEFYEWRKLISQELIANHKFNFIAVEGDWPACSQINQYIKDKSPMSSAAEALNRFVRWPTWMWANTEVAELVDWMKKNNKGRDEKAGFHGLDVYSLFESIDEIIKKLTENDPALARRARMHYECFDPFQRDEKAYARALAYIPEGCEKQVVAMLENLLQIRVHESIRQDELFDVQQNARIVKNADCYYRTMIHGDEDSWNVRDRHMLETLELLLNKYGPDAKAIVWAHNSHIGDYRATDMINEGQVNIGGLAREKWGEEQVALVGFGTYQGEVIASHAWDGPVEIMTVPPGRPQSYEALFHSLAQSTKKKSFFLWLRDMKSRHEFNQTLGHRAIGVVYQPAYERLGNYIPTSLSNRYDGFIYFDQTSALTPLGQPFNREELPETWPSGT